MRRAILIVLAFLSPLLFPWPLTVVLALIAAWVSPIIPLAVGLFIDGLYYARGTSMLIPWATVLGAVGALGALLVRRFLETSIMQ